MLTAADGGVGLVLSSLGVMDRAWALGIVDG
jgi:hypothetical protein